MTTSLNTGCILLFDSCWELKDLNGCIQFSILYLFMKQNLIKGKKGNTEIQNSALTNFSQIFLQTLTYRVKKTDFQWFTDPVAGSVDASTATLVLL